MDKVIVSQLYDKINQYTDKEILVKGWIKTIRNSKTVGFIEVNDGSCFKNLQVIFEENKLSNYKEIAKLNVGSAIKILGNIIITADAKQAFEINATQIDVEGECTSDYPLQKKRHSLEFLRTIPHLRSRTNTLSSVFRIRSKASYYIHEFFNKNDFIYIHTPIITASDCEGAGEMFKVTTIDYDKILSKNIEQVDYTKDFFGKEAGLTVSGQLEGETMALAFGKVYTFGPTFRAEKSNTTRHASEFWMIEPEIAFADLRDDMLLAESMMKYVIKNILESCPDEIEFFNKFYDNELLKKLNGIIENKFEYITYTEAIDILTKSNVSFEFPVKWGNDLQTEHEKYLTEIVFKKPVFIIDYPKEIKSFYMRVNDDDKTVAAMDLLVPGIGEIIGGSQREERYDVLKNKMNDKGLDINQYGWYLDLRKYGGVNHAGFGLGFERLIMYLTGISNIRDVIPYPRTVGTII